METFQHYVDVKSYDVRPGLGTHDYVDVIAQDVLVAALPTPMLKDGSVDVSIVEAELDKLAARIDEAKNGARDSQAAYDNYLGGLSLDK